MINITKVMKSSSAKFRRKEIKVVRRYLMLRKIGSPITKKFYITVELFLIIHLITRIYIILSELYIHFQALCLTIYTLNGKFLLFRRKCVR